MNGRCIVMGVTGGIAAFKTAGLVSQLVQNGAEVHVTLSQAAEAFVGPATFAALTGNRVLRDVFDEQYPLGAHIYLAERAELLCVAPATANFLAKAAHGIADDLLGTVYLACSCPVLLAPAMNNHMWEHPAVQRNIAQLRADGVQFVEPDEGWLSCRQSGKGRMASPEAIYSAIQEVLSRRNKRD